MATEQSRVDRAIEAVCTNLGYAGLTPEQEKGVRSFVSGRDVFLSLPTGSGKSLCFAALPWIFDELHQQNGGSIVIVVSPLIAVMKDQVKFDVSVPCLLWSECTTCLNFSRHHSFIHGLFYACRSVPSLRGVEDSVCEC